jgi:magnesium chelatase family protein
MERIPAMSLAIIYSRSADGVLAPQVFVEAHLSNGLPSLSIVGLPQAAVKESKDRVRGALLNSGFEFPPRRITINLAPADIPKEGGRFDLPIAIGILVASGQIAGDNLENYEFTAELALSGELRPVSGILPAAMQVARQGRTLVVAEQNGQEASLVKECSVLAAVSLAELTAHLNGQQRLTSVKLIPVNTETRACPDLAEVRGQRQAKRALEIAAAGGHSMLMSGPPGSGKTMLASRLPGILPEMTRQEALETAAIYSIGANDLDLAQWKLRPFRSPHHTASAIALVGGGSKPLPGEISLAHNGVLFLDELPEFGRHVLEVLREPMESGVISISRAGRQAEYPARFQFLAAMNPCPCGYLGESSGRCRCTPEQIDRYRARLSGPLLDRIDLQLEVSAVPVDVLLESHIQGECSADVRQKVSIARQQQLQRSGTINSQLSPLQLDNQCCISSPARSHLASALSQLGLSARSFHRILRVARTIADLAASEEVLDRHIAEAIHYRRLDRYLKNIT